MKPQHCLNIFFVIVNANSIATHVIQIKYGIIINDNTNVKNITRAKKIVMGILAHVVVSIVGI